MSFPHFEKGLFSEVSRRFEDEASIKELDNNSIRTGNSQSCLQFVAWTLVNSSENVYSVYLARPGPPDPRRRLIVGFVSFQQK